MRSPALIPDVTRGCHAVLAAVSRCYSPLGGRSPTRYSPVRRSTRGLPPFRARLACVRHAASVDSEPGSNSPVKLETPSRAPLRTEGTSWSLRAESRRNLLLRLPSFQRATPTLGDQTRIPKRGRAVNPSSGLLRRRVRLGGKERPSSVCHSHGTRCNAPGRRRYYETRRPLSSAFLVRSASCRDIEGAPIDWGLAQEGPKGSGSRPRTRTNHGPPEPR